MTNSLIIPTSFTPRKAYDLNNMSYRDWAEIVIDFLNYCKPTILSRNDPWDQFKSSKNFGLSSEKLRFFSKLSNLLTYSQNCLWQKIDWDLIHFPEKIDPAKIKVFSLVRYEYSIMNGVTSIVGLTEDAHLIICRINFNETADMQRGGKDSVYHATGGDIFFANEQTLELFFKRIHSDGQSLLMAIYEFTIDTIRFHEENIAEEKVNTLSREFREGVLSKMAIT